ncbi:MAG: GntR family transcriptional regulator [Streptosporangiaceae bacterium]
MTRTATPVNFILDLQGRTGHRASRVAYALIDAIACGQVHDGDRLPSTRTLAATFGLARTAVVGAYDELAAAGFLVARPGGSTYVEHGAAAAARAGAFGASLSRPGRQTPHRQTPHRTTPVTYDLRPGQADTELISERDWARAMRPAASPARQSGDVAGQLISSGVSAAGYRSFSVSFCHGDRGLSADRCPGLPAGRGYYGGRLAG